MRVWADAEASMLTRLVMVGVAAISLAGPAGARTQLDAAASAPPAREALAPSAPAPSDMARISSTASVEGCLSVKAKDRGVTYQAFRSPNGHTQEVTGHDFETVVTYTCPIARGVVVVAKLGRTLFGGCRSADQYEMTFVPSVKRLKINGIQKNCVVSVVSTSGV